MVAFASVTNVDGSNPGPNSVLLPETIQLPVGNIWKWGLFTLTLSPASVANATSAEQTFTMTGLLTTDYVSVSTPSPQGGLGIVNSRVTASGVIGITFGNFTAATITPTSTIAYQVLWVRPQPSFVQQTTGSVIDY